MKCPPTVPCAKVGFVGLAAIAIVALIAASSATADEPLPPDSNYRGNTFEEWNVLAADNAIRGFLGSGGFDNPVVNGVRLLPGAQTPDPSGPVFEFDIQVSPGTGFCLGPWFGFGEAYDNGGADDPTDPVLKSLIEECILPTTEIMTILDGDVLLEGTATELADYGFGPAFFDEPIPYEEPQFRFEENGNPVNAVAALWVMGIGSVYGPLPPGEHTLVHIHFSPFFGQTEEQVFVYHITVGD